MSYAKIETFERRAMVHTARGPHEEISQYRRLTISTGSGFISVVFDAGDFGKLLAHPGSTVPVVEIESGASKGTAA